MMVLRNILIDVVGCFIVGYLKLLKIEILVDIKDFLIYL